MRSSRACHSIQLFGRQSGSGLCQFCRTRAKTGHLDARAGDAARNTDAQDGQTKSNSYEPNFGVEKQIRLPGKYRLDQDLAQPGMSIPELKYEDAKHEVAKTLLNQWFAYMRSKLCN